MKIFWLIRTDSFRLPRFEDRQFQIFLDIYSPLLALTNMGLGFGNGEILFNSRQEYYSFRNWHLAAENSRQPQTRVLLI